VRMLRRGIGEQEHPPETVCRAHADRGFQRHVTTGRSNRRRRTRRTWPCEPAAGERE
jgi:hypothetical protein